MSDSHEPSYYEIALTNRQVLFAFVILLVCLLAAFVAGVWVGRGGEVQAASPPAGERLADQAGAAGATGANGEALEKLSFFGDDRAAAPAKEVAAPTTGGTTLRDDLERGAPPAPPPAPPAAGAAADRKPEPAPPAPPPPTTTATAPPPAAAAPAAEPTGGLVIQVFSSRDKEQADKVVSQLKRGGRPAFLSPVEVVGQPMYRVRIGPYADRAEAQKVADAVRREFKLDTWITQ